MKILYFVDYYQPQLGYSEYFLPKEWDEAGHVRLKLSSESRMLDAKKQFLRQLLGFFLKLKKELY